MSVTDDFRAELDKHDVTWVNVTPLITGFVVGGKAYRAYEYDGMDEMDGLQLLSATPLTPQEVIAATLGAVRLEKATAKRMPNTWGFSSYYCGCCGHKLAEVANGLNEHFPNYCESCGTKAVYE